MWLLVGQVKDLSERLQIPQVRVQQLVTTFLKLCADSIVEGYEISIPGLFRVVKFDSVVVEKRTWGYIAMQAAQLHGESVVAAIDIIVAYLDIITERLKSGKRVTLYRLATFYVKDGVVHGRLSSVVRGKSKSKQALRASQAVLRC